MSFPFLTALIFIPIIGAAFIFLFSNKNNTRNSFNMAFWISIITFLISLIICISFDFSFKNYQFTEEVILLPSLNMGYRLGIDRISLLILWSSLPLIRKFYLFLIYSPYLKKVIKLLLL